MAKRQSTTKKTRSPKKTYFFSDVHLGLGKDDQDRQKEQRLIRFLDFIKNDAEQIFIIGDLFDYWFEYKTVVPKGYYSLFAKFAELREKNIRLLFIAGNHDYWVKSYFQDEFGMQISLTPVEKNIQGKRFFLHHGDGLLRDDAGYKILKKIVRNKINIFLFSLVHPDLTGRIARWSSRTSRQYTDGRSYEETGMIEFAARKIEEGYDYIIMGHNHKPMIQKIGNGVYINLGDWIVENTFAVFDGKKMELKKWKH